MTNSLRTWKWPSRNSECSHETWWIFPVRFLWTWKPGGSHGALEISGISWGIHWIGWRSSPETHGFSPWKSIGFVSTGRQHGWWHVWWPIFERIWDVQQKEQQMGTSSSKLNWWIVVSQGKTNGFFTKFNLYMILRRKLTCPHDEAFDCYRLAHFWKETDGWMAAQDWPNQIWCYPPVSTNVAMGNPLWMDI